MRTPPTPKHNHGGSSRQEKDERREDVSERVPWRAIWLLLGRRRGRRPGKWAHGVVAYALFGLTWPLFSVRRRRIYSWRWCISIFFPCKRVSDFSSSPSAPRESARPIGLPDRGADRYGDDRYGDRASRYPVSERPVGGGSDDQWRSRGG